MIGVALAGVGFLVGWHGLAIPGGLLVVAGVLSALIDLPAPPDRCSRPRPTAIRRSPTSATGWPSRAPPARSCWSAWRARSCGRPPPIWRTSTPSGVVRCDSASASPSSRPVPAARAGYRYAAVRLHDAATDAPRTLVAVALTVVCLPGLFFHDPDLDLVVAPWFGTVIVVTIFLAGLAMLVVWADRVSFVIARRSKSAGRVPPDGPARS